MHVDRVELVRQNCFPDFIRSHPIQACSSILQLGTRIHSISPNTSSTFTTRITSLARFTHPSLRLSTSTTHPLSLSYITLHLHSSSITLSPEMPHYFPSQKHDIQYVAQPQPPAETQPPAQPQPTAQPQRPDRPHRHVRPPTCDTGEHLQQQRK
ncbi:hypothetical protein PIB30_071671, partial [Stylosanthes scabra]|nr:hypothetical protein [Stylosanthes scabra]